MEEEKSMFKNVQAFRDMVRPILTLMLAVSFVSSVLVTLCVALKTMWATNTFELDLLVALIAILGNPFSMIMTYHFMKSSKRDNDKTSPSDAQI